jgi:ribosomal protein S18 acetylase RimI-like enzyme
MEITYQVVQKIERDSLLDLYNNAGWTAYTDRPEELENAIKNSLYVLIAMDRDKLIGLIRIVGDGLTIVYIQDILVRKNYKRNNIGTKLMTQALERFKDVRQKVLLTDDNNETRGFYESLGFESCDKGSLVSFVKLKNKN